MRRCVMTHIRAPARASNQTGSKCCFATANEESRISNDKGVHRDAFLRLGHACPRADELFSLSRYLSEVRAVETTAQ